MNASHSHAPLAPRTPAPVLPASGPDHLAAPRYRARDFGTGYGRSSGYAAERRYTSDWGQARFRCG
ncbi:hypothetical protein [Lysobacter brunescens]|uniref:Uncharacterized protein n=1 Tax=Lysobacter brunescens TaxID=262323 RepID=A0ABW2Y959_9GAMM